MHPRFPQNGWSWNSQELLRYNPYFYSGQDLQRSAMQPYGTKNRENRIDQNGFRRNRSRTSQILTISQILEGIRAKNLKKTLLFVGYFVDSILRGKMEQILLAYGFPKETIEAIMMLYKTTKVKVPSPDGDTDFFDIVAGVLQGDTLYPYLFIISLDYVLRTSIDLMKENGFTLTKERSRRYPAQTITDMDYADDSVSGKYTCPRRIPAT